MINYLPHRCAIVARCLSQASSSSQWSFVALTRVRDARPMRAYPNTKIARFINGTPDVADELNRMIWNSPSDVIREYRSRFGRSNFSNWNTDRQQKVRTKKTK